MTYSILVLFDLMPAWLRLSPDEREAFNQSVIQPIFAKQAQDINVRLFDSEAFSATCSDFALFETKNIGAFYYLIEELRNSQLYTEPLIQIKNIIIGIEGGFRQYHFQEAKQ